MPHEKNYHSTKLEFLALKWAVIEHFKKYLPYQPFLVKMDNNPLTYIMMTPKLDATGHWWVCALMWFNFELECQKGYDNTVADALSWVTTQLDPDTVRSILDGVPLGTVHQAKVHDPVVVEGDTEWNKRYVSPQAVHLYKYTLLIGPEPRERTQCWAQYWTVWRHRRRQIWRHFWQNTPPAKKDSWSYGNQQNFTIHQGTLYLCSMPKGDNQRSSTLCGP